MGPKHRTRPTFVTAFVLFAVIACLCFSVGEGLRLRPFTSSASVSASHPSGTQFNGTTTSVNTRNKYGPISVPERVQRRGDADAEDLDKPASLNGTELVVQSPGRFDLDDRVSFTSPLLESNSSGRAPPFHS